MGANNVLTESSFFLEPNSGLGFAGLGCLAGWWAAGCWLGWLGWAGCWGWAGLGWVGGLWAGAELGWAAALWAVGNPETEIG